MAQPSITEIRELRSEELQSRLRDLKQERLNLRLQQATGEEHDGTLFVSAETAN